MVLTVVMREEYAETAEYAANSANAADSLVQFCVGGGGSAICG